MKRQDIFVAGHPRSGNTWLNRLLSDLLDSPLSDLSRGKPSRKFCEGCKGNYLVIKTHWQHHEWGGKDKLVFIQRDPRDVVMSLLFYRAQLPTNEVISETIKQICGNYENYIRPWLACDRAAKTKYELLHTQPIAELQKFSIAIIGRPQKEEKITAILNRQAFKKWKGQFPHSMRKGIIGDWKTYFKQQHKEQIADCLNQLMLDTGYIDDINWCNMRE
jgi:hypothetical protein